MGFSEAGWSKLVELIGLRPLHLMCFIHTVTASQMLPTNSNCYKCMQPLSKKDWALLNGVVAKLLLDPSGDKQSKIFLRLELLLH